MLGNCVIATEISVKGNVLLVPFGARKQARVATASEHPELNHKLRESLRVWCVVGTKIGSIGVYANMQNQI